MAWPVPLAYCSRMSKERAILENFAELAKRMAERTEGRPADCPAATAWCQASIWTTRLVDKLRESVLARELYDAAGVRLLVGGQSAAVGSYALDAEWALERATSYAWHDIGRRYQHLENEFDAYD